ncbi:MAG TPA: hypothetical protein VGR06_22640 [Actinophytocola sp.]|jgi:hypothetical protein|nr:hypothetical protein [Actinophytocola sp.]
MSRAGEAEHEQLARSLNELLQEIRVAQAGGADPVRIPAVHRVHRTVGEC